MPDNVMLDRTARKYEDLESADDDDCGERMTHHDPVYRFTGAGCNVEVFDPRVVVLHVGRSPATVSEEVTKLAELRQRGVLSDAEFVAAKRRVIGE